jgi:hypothetical protein
MTKRYADDVTIDYIIRLRKLEQENERLREFLQQIADIDDENIPSPKNSNEGMTWSVLAMTVTLAKRALKETE